MKGALILTEQVSKGITSLTFDLGYLSNGLYTLLYTDSDGITKPCKFELIR